MNNYVKTLSIALLLISCKAHATTGLSSLESLWIVFLVFGLIILALVILGVFWLKITWVYLIKNESKFYRLKLYITLTTIITIVSGVSAFTFHQNAPYSQNVYFLSAAILVLVVSIISMVMQYKKIRNSNEGA